MRGRVIQGLARKIRFEGDTGTYIGELAVVYFTAIKHTADWYLASFKENEVASCKFVAPYSCGTPIPNFSSIHNLDKISTGGFLPYIP